MAETHAATIILAVRTQNAEFAYTVTVNGALVAGERHLSATNVAQLTKRHVALLRSGAAPEQLAAIGADLYNLSLKDCWDTIKARLPKGQPATVLVASESADVLNLPWELLTPPGLGPLGLDQRFAIRRAPWSDRALAPAGTLRARPLRVLFMACAPQGEAPLDFEREEQLLYEALASPNVVLETCDMGSFEELKEKINQFQPHIVHLSGHGALDGDGLGWFAFEDERGETDSRSADEIGQLLAGSDVQCAFISGCETATAPPIAVLGGICQQLVAKDVPMAIGWAAPIADDLATRFAREFYRTVAAGKPVDFALTQARQVIEKDCEKRGTADWTLPVLYASSQQALAYDPNPRRPKEDPDRQQVTQYAIPGMGDTGFTRSFVGRRREQQRLLPALRSGEIQLLLLTGIGGAGKSTLATRLARKLEVEGYTLIAMASSDRAPISAATLLDSVSRHFLGPEFERDYQILQNAQIPVPHRLFHLVQVLNRHRFVLILDNFEANLIEATREIADKELEEFCGLLLTYLTGESRVIITTRYRPAIYDDLRRCAHAEALGDFGEASFFKFLLRDAEVERRYTARQLPHELLQELNRLLGGTPRFLEQIRQVLGRMDADELEREVAALQGAESKGLLKEKRDEYCEQIFLGRLFDSLSAEAQQALCRTAVYTVPMSLAGLSAVTGAPESQLENLTRQWQSLALAYPDQDRTVESLWTVYAVLRDWLLGRLTPDEWKAVHHAAGVFFVETCNADQEGALGLGAVECYLHARAHYLQAGSYDQARKVSHKVTENYLRWGLYQEAIRLNEDLLDHDEHPAPMNWVGSAHHAMGDYAQARAWFERCLACAGDTLLYEAVAWHNLASIDLIQGAYARAQERCYKALEIRMQIGDRAGQAATWHQLASIDLEEGASAEAQAKYRKALEIMMEIGDMAGEAAIWHQLASIDLEQGAYADAKAKFQKALDINMVIGNRAGQAATRHQLAFIDLDQGAYAEALTKLRQCLAIGFQIGDAAALAGTFAQLGLVAYCIDRPFPAIRLVALCYWIHQSIGHGEAESDFEALVRMASKLNLTEEQVASLIQEVAKAYETDQGRSLVQAAFPDAEESPA